MWARRRLAAITIVALTIAGCDGTSIASTGPSAPADSLEPVVVASPAGSTAAETSPSVLPSESPSPTPAPGVAALDGVGVDPARASRLPIAVMIDDATAARPQAGFNAASIVYQAPADGGEDRYMMVFQEGDAKVIGPVRSGRPFFVRWAAEYRSGFAHYGGDAKTLAHIPAVNGRLIFDLDALRNAASAYHRDTSRSAPHNAYTSTVQLRRVAARLGAPRTLVSGLAIRPFGDDLALSQRPAGGSITVPYGRGAASYTYDRWSNAYLRSVAGRPQIDAGDGRRVTARNVVVLFMRLSYDPQSEPGHRRPVLAQIGTGAAIVFRDGQALPGTWRKDDEGGLTRLFDRSGAEIRLVRGRIFVQVVPSGTRVTYRTR
jgi:hypothetical protein